jgi:hypothetical protein
VTDVKQTAQEEKSEFEPRAWEPMSLTKVGTFGDVLRGGTGKGEDAIGKKAG